MATAAIAADDTAFFGHPRGLAYLSFTEAWERFSYYGMTALVVLYMTQQLLLPGHAGHVAGLAGFRHALESVFGPLSTQAFASQIFGLYTGFVYFTPVLGGWIADRFLGARRTVVIGSILMSAGHFAMAFDQSFLIALLLLIVGTGCLKGNISAQVGHLYPPDDETMRTRGYTIFSVGINVGAVVGPLACGLLAQLYGWHVGFGAAGVLMLMAMFTYLAGQRYLPTERPMRRRDAAPSAPLTPAERRIVGLLFAVMAITVFQSVAYYQITDVGIVFVDAHANLATPFGQIPTPWFNSIDAFVSIVAVPPLLALWRWQARHGGEPGDVTKIGIGAAIVVVANLILALAAMLAGDGRTTVLLPFVGFALTGVGFLYYWPTLLTLVSQAAPARVNGTMMGVAFLSLFVSNLLIGWIGGYYEPLGPTAFWLLQAAISAGGVIAVLLFGRTLARALEPGADEIVHPQSALTAEAGAD
jgi:POT family proton-dependent oligopeptide transporter